MLVPALVLAAMLPLPALAAPAARIDAGTLLFFSDTLDLVAHNGATLHVGGFVLSGDAAYVSLRADRALVAGNAQITRGTTTLHADAIAVDLPGRRIDLLNGDTGIARADATLEQLQPAPGDGDAFDFPDLIDKH